MGVAVGLVDAAQLNFHFFDNGHSGGVICCCVYAEAAC
jgi:hypothetical protein